MAQRNDLPLHRPAIRPPKKSRARQVGFEQEGYKSSWQRRWKNIINRITHASTGTPSDGLGDGTTSESSVPTLTFAGAGGSEKDDTDWMVDEVVVSDDPDHSHNKSDRGTNTGTRRSDTSSVRHEGMHTEGGTDREDLYTGSVTAWLRWRAWPAIIAFFNPRFDDKDREEDFQKQSWYSSKAFTFYGSIYLVINWVLYLILNLQSTRNVLYAEIFFYGALTFVTVPLPFMVARDWARKWPIFFQIWFAAATWCCGLAEVIEIKQCGFFTNNHCHGKDFLAMSYYINGLPAMMMFIGSRRLYNAVPQFVVFVLTLSLIIPDQKIYARNLVSFALFSCMIQALHYSREMVERRIFMLNTQLKVAYRAQQKAQIAESKASLAKRRFASYIFHEVRVPLNTAMLAFQNMQVNQVFREFPQHTIEVYALEASLGMMQQVLNDVLDLQKMDAGHFESNPRPFQIHRAVNNMLQPIAIATSARHLNLRINLDPRIDELAPTYQPSDAPSSSSDPLTSGEKVAQDRIDHEGLWVVGDELRLRQVLTNLASNAVKFTPDGAGDVQVTSRLLEVRGPDTEKEKAEDEILERQKEVSGGDLEANIGSTSSQPNGTRHGLGDHSDSFGSHSSQSGRNMLVVRFEVKDNGPGIKPSDLVDGRLFQPFVQTNVGISSGKGTGLGLAIVRQIVSLSGGRLGVLSKKGQGALFWFEIAYPIATPAELSKLRGSASHHSNSRILPVLSLAPPSPSSPTTLGGGEGIPPLPNYQSQESFEKRARAMTSPSSPLSPPTSNTNPSPAPDALAILVVDDDPMTRALMTRMLVRQGCIVDTAENGQECLDIVTSPGARRYDLISLDNFMPVMTGEKAVRELRALGRTDLVVGCTGNALTEDQRSYLEAGADHVLTKPIMIKDIKEVLEVARQRRNAALDPS